MSENAGLQNIRRIIFIAIQAAGGKSGEGLPA